MRMKQNGVLFVVVTVLAVTCFARAQEGKLGVEVDATWVSKYLWHGFPVFGDQPAFQPSVNLDLYGTGFSLEIWGAFGDSARVETYQELDYTLAYDCRALEDTDYATDIRFNFIFYDFKQWGIDKHEVGAGLAWPNIFPNGVVPGYYFGSMWPRKHYGTGDGYLQGNASGFIHVFSLAYDLTVPGFLPDTDEQVLNLSADLTYNDGYGARYRGPTADHDWSHSTFAVATDIAVGELTFRPAVYYQISMDSSVNDEDELVTGLSLLYSF